MNQTLPLILLAMGTLSAQSLVVDRRPGSPAKTQRIELAAGGFLGDFFRIGAQGEVWMFDSIRLWFAPAQGTACGSSPGDSIERLTLLGALDNPPVPGQPVCDCHALAPLATAPFDRGASVPAKDGELWRVDFENVRWSIPGASNAVFTMGATPRGRSECKAAAGWSLAVAETRVAHHLHVLNEKGVPVGLEEKESAPIAIQVRAQRWK